MRAMLFILHSETRGSSNGYNPLLGAWLICILRFIGLDRLDGEGELSARQAD